MKTEPANKRLPRKHFFLALIGALGLLGILGAAFWLWPPINDAPGAYRYVHTISGTGGEFGEPFGIAVKGTDIYVSDGEHGRIWKIRKGRPQVFVEGFHTPSAIAFDAEGSLIVADSGTHTIKSVSATGEIRLVAGVEGKSGFADGEALSALFNAPVGVAVYPDGRIVVADTYNDRIRVIENGRVSTLAGAAKGHADGVGEEAEFDTPCGVAIWHDKLLIADTGNRRLRVVEADRRVWTLAGTGDEELADGLLASSTFVQPTSVSVAPSGSIFVADGNAVRQITSTAIPVVRTISDPRRGIKDGAANGSRFSRVSGLATDAAGALLVADSENRLVRGFSSKAAGHEISSEEIGALRDKPSDFRSLRPARWPFDPPNAKRDIAGTLGEIRGEMKDNEDQVWFHNGLDIAGAYGETARFIRDEKVLRPIAAENFGTLREFIRMPTLGYIHIRLGRNLDSEPFDDPRFQFEKDNTAKLTGVRVPRGVSFSAGDAIGTLNAMNHVHLVAGRSGYEMNALDALILPGISDSRPPVIEKVSLYDQNWNPVETVSQNSRIKINGKTRIVVRAYDQKDGNSERRRLGVYRLGYQILKNDESPTGDVKWTVNFNRLPSAEAVGLAYANGSHSGATGETIFNYIVTNMVDGEEFREDFLDFAEFGAGEYTLRVLAADYFGNITSKGLSMLVE